MSAHEGLVTAPTERPSSPDRVFDIRSFEPLARERLDRAAFDYIAGGSWDEVTMRDNVDAFARLRFRPRVLVDVSAVDLASEWLGMPVELPVGVAPMAFQHFAHPEAELASARAAARAGAVFCLSTLSSRSLEDVAEAAEEATLRPPPRWFQLYVHRDRSVSEALIARASEAGYSSVVVTVDLPVAGYRQRDLVNGLAYPQVFGNLRVKVPGDAPLLATVGGFNDAALTWDDIAWLRSLSRLPVLVKGILTAEDARLAVEHGAAGMVVSNHGGRQLDRSITAIDALEGVVTAVEGRAEVYLDSGVTRGLDALAAIALGARGVFVGRPAFYALAAFGEAGVDRVFELLRAEIKAAMALLGVRRISEIGRGHLV